MSEAVLSARPRSPEPSMWDEILADPTVPFDRDALAMAVRDQRRWSRTWVYPVARIVSRVAVALIVVVKRILPVQFSAHPVMDRLCVWFLRRFVSVEAGKLLIRHFVIETNLLEFVARNACPGRLPPVELRPTTLPELGDRAVIEHDLNVYRVLTGVGETLRDPDRRLPAPVALDRSMLDVPAIDAEPDRRRYLRLDIQTALCLMNIPFALCLSSHEYRRAVHSLRLDESLLATLTMLTGDPTFRSWRPGGGMVRVDSTCDVPRAVYEHAVICEYAHAYLRDGGLEMTT